MRLIPIFIPCLLLSACVFGTSQNAKFYTQSATVQAIISPNYTAFIGVNRVQVPKYIDRPQIVTQQKDSTQIHISEYNRWVESPSVLATRVLAEDLSALLPASQIKVNHLKGERFDQTISVEIVNLTAVLGDRAELVAWYTLKGNSGKIYTQKKFTGTVSIGKTYNEVAQGYSQLLAQLSQEIAGALIQNNIPVEKSR